MTKCIEDTKLSSNLRILTPPQYDRLIDLLNSQVHIHPHGPGAELFPTLSVRLGNAVERVHKRLSDVGVDVTDVRVNGGAACHVIAHETNRHLDNKSSNLEKRSNIGSHKNPSYNDLDLIYLVRLQGAKDMDRIKNVVLETLFALYCESSHSPALESSNTNDYDSGNNSDNSDDCPDSKQPIGQKISINSNNINRSLLQEMYVHKMVKVSSGGDLWSLIALNNRDGRNLEFKFVSSMKRQFEFSVDSFQIILDPLLKNYRQEKAIPTHQPPLDIVCESMYGDFDRSERHLRQKLIATVRPEEIRGGGLLKYCHLLVQGYEPEDYDDIKSLEKYMCSRFFIDFGDLRKQKDKLDSYLHNHFLKDPHSLYNYLLTLYRVVDHSTVCLMGHERREILKLIEKFFYQVYYNVYSYNLLHDSTNIKDNFKYKYYRPKNFSNIPPVYLPPSSAQHYIQPIFCSFQPISQYYQQPFYFIPIVNHNHPPPPVSYSAKCTCIQYA
ncbi:unnamed protein product [Gordionus sp. m RMFG-2023]|uniref:terminal nucleotidyltransferase 5C-like n=1 Tax=Gordionus sp. m RMFG-2023 TaxID=3053472 RepID=UPI0030E2F59B